MRERELQREALNDAMKKMRDFMEIIAKKNNGNGKVDTHEMMKRVKESHISYER